MKEEIIDGIKYRLDEETLTAEVIELKDALELDETKLTAEKLMKMMFNGYEGDVIIPETVEFKGVTYRVTSIGAETFTWCEKLKSIAIPNSITSIGDRAFYQCTELTTITIPESVTSIGKGAFENCKKLTSIIIPDNVKSVEDMTFSWCFALTEIVIPNSVTSIGYEAFECCFALTEIEIPDSMETIGGQAFGGCKSLNSITFQGTIAQWKDIELSDGWNDEIPAKVVHCTDGDVEI